MQSENYEQFFALFLLRNRSQVRYSSMIQLGIFAGLGHHIGKKLTRDWFDSIYDDPDRAQFEYERYRAGLPS
jgi:hypothetical protein